MKFVGRKRVQLLMLAALISGACESTPTTTVDPAAITLAAGATTVTLEQGGTASLPVTITRTGDFTGAVGVTVTGLPTGVTASALSIGTGSTTGTITLTATAAVTPATATLTVHATGTGVAEKTVTVALNTTVKGSYTLAATPLTLAAGTGGQSVVTATRLSGFTGSIALAMTLPAGITATISSTTLDNPATAAQLNITVAASVVPGTYNVVVTGTSQGLANQTVTIPVSVTAGAGFTMTASPTTVTIAQGASAASTVTLVRSGSFLSPVALTSTTNAPSGLTVSFNPASITGLTSAVTITAAPTLAAGSYTVTVAGAGTGVTSQSAIINVTVTAVATPAISLAVAPSPISITAGASGNATLTVTRLGGFTGAVAVTADAAPAGLTVTANPTSIGAASTTSTITVGVAGTVAVGTYNITLRGNGPGVTESIVTVPVTVTAAPAGITLSAVPAAFSVAAGSTGNTTLNITRTGAFTGAVALTADVSASGITVAFNPASIASASTTSIATVTVPGALLAGTYNITIRANGTGVTEQTFVLLVTVTAASGGFTLSALPTSLTIAQGGNANSTLTVTRTGSFAGHPQLSATAPAGVTVTFNPTIVTGTTSTMNVAIAGSVPVGTANVTITAVGTGVTTQTLVVPVTVTAVAPPVGGNVTFNFCGATGVPVYAAAKNGAGAWQQVGANANGSISFQIDAAGGFAYVSPITTGGFHTEVIYGSAADLNRQGARVCQTQTGTGKTVLGTTTGLGANDITYITLGRSQGVRVNNAVTFSDVINGPVDLLAGRSAFNLGTFGFDPPDKLVLQRNLNPAANSTIPINYASGFTPQSSTATIVNLGAGPSDATTLLHTYSTANNSFGAYYIDFPSGSTARTWYGFPASAQAEGDTHVISVAAAGLADPTNSRVVTVVSTIVKPLTFTLGPLLNVPTISVLGTTGYVKMRAVYPIQTAYPDYFIASFNQNPSTASLVRTVSVSAFPSFTGATTATLDIPDLTGIGTWDNNYGLKAGTVIDWSVSATKLSSVLLQPFTDGQVYTSASKTGTITP